VGGSGEPIPGERVACDILNGAASGPTCSKSWTKSLEYRPGNLSNYIEWGYVELRATPSDDTRFVGWGGACSDEGNDQRCNLRYTTDSRVHNFLVSARFELIPGDIQVTTATTGFEPVSPSDYSVLIDSELALTIGRNATATSSDLTPGTHLVELADVPAYCTVDGANPRAVTVTSEETAQTAFSIHCVEPGAIEVTTKTRGEGLYPKEYTVIVDTDLVETVDPNATIQFEDLRPGDHSVVLAGVPENCSVSGDPNRTLTVVGGETASTTFVVDCFPSGKGSILVTTETTGQALDPDGFQVFVNLDGRSIGVNDEELFHSLDPGDYAVELMGIASNCTVDTSTLPNPRTVTVQAGAVETTTFRVTCAAQGSIRVTTETTGWDDDPDGYRVFIENTTLTANLGSDGEHIFEGLTAGDYTIHLDEASVAENCVVQGNNPTGPHPLGAGQTMYVPFKVWCSGIAFESDRGGFLQIWAMGSTGTPPDQLTFSTFDDGQPSWSPDRRRIVFVSERDGNDELYLLELGLDETVSSVTRVTTHPADDKDPSFSPDGTQVVFESERSGVSMDLYIKDLEGGVGFRRITDGPGDEEDADWSPDGNWVVFSMEDAVSEAEIYKIDISRNPLPSPVRLTVNGVDDDDPVWSPDGTKIAFEREDAAGNGDIFVMNADGTNVVQLTTHPAQDGDPVWSPDGTMIAWVSERTGNAEIFIMNALDGSGKINITNTPFHDDEPTWK